MRDDKDESESVRWPLRQDAGNRARLSRHAGRHRAGGRHLGAVVESGRDGCRPRVRACRSKRRRALCGDGKKKGLWNYMAAQPVLTRRSLNLAACGGKRARKKRKVTIRAARVKLVPPGDRRQSPLHARRVGCRTARPRLAVAHDGGRTREDDAVRIVKWYERRWTIEEYFKALKSGMGVEDRQFDDADDLRKCLAFDAITACRVLQRMARDRPDAPADEVADEDEIAVLYLDLAERGMVKSRAPPENLDVRTFVVDVGRLAGFIPTPAVARGPSRSGRATSTSGLTFKSTRRYGTTTCSRTQQWGVERSGRWRHRRAGQQRQG